MSKAVLVMDMPSSCSGCPCCWTTMCEVLGKSLTSSEIFVCKPEWCPLKPMPEKKDICGTYNSEYYAKGGMTPSAKKGYNACIDELFGYNPYQE